MEGALLMTERVRIMEKVGEFPGGMPIYLNPEPTLGPGYVIVTVLDEDKTKEGQYHLVVVGGGGVHEQRMTIGEVRALAKITRKVDGQT